MAYSTFTKGTFWPPKPDLTGVGLTSLTIDATGEKIGVVGDVWTPNSGAKSIRKLHLPFGAITKAGGSGLVASLQNVTSASTYPMLPDETQDETVAISAAEITANTVVTTGNLSADRNVTHGDQLAIVLEFDGSGRLGSDSYTLRFPIRSNVFGGAPAYPGVALKTASWTLNNVAPNIILEFSDGTFGCITNSFITSAGLTAVQFKQDTAGADEYGNQIVIPSDCNVKFDGGWLLVGTIAATADYDIVLYNDTTSVGSRSIDGSQHNAGSEPRLMEFSFASELECLAGSTINFTIKPTQTTSNVLAYYNSVNASGHMALHTIGSCILTKRLDVGSFTTVSTQRMMMGLRVSGIEPVSSGGGRNSILGC